MHIGLRFVCTERQSLCVRINRYLDQRRVHYAIGVEVNGRTASGRRTHGPDVPGGGRLHHDNIYHQHHFLDHRIELFDPRHSNTDEEHSHWHMFHILLPSDVLRCMSRHRRVPGRTRESPGDVQKGDSTVRSRYVVAVARERFNKNESPTIFSSMCSPPLSDICQFYF